MRAVVLTARFLFSANYLKVCYNKPYKTKTEDIMDYSQILSQQFNIKEEYAKNIITLLDDGNTIPFIARYRKEMHGSMDDQLIREFAEKLEYLRGLDKRRDEIRSLMTHRKSLPMKSTLHLTRLPR